MFALHIFFGINQICHVLDTGSINHSRVRHALVLPHYIHLVSSHEPWLCSVLWASWWIISNQIIDKVHAEQRDKKAKVTPGDLIELWEIKYKLCTVTIYNYKRTIIRGTRNTTRHLLLEVGWLMLIVMKRSFFVFLNTKGINGWKHFVLSLI